MSSKSQVKIAVVDDSFEIAEQHKELLQAEGFENVYEFTDPKMLIDLVVKGGILPDIVISDFNMGVEINGVELLNSLRKLNPALKALIVTGNPADVASITKDFPVINKDCFTIDQITKFANACLLELK